MKLTIAVAISGGVDSMMAACLLKEQGHHILGIHFLTGYETGKDAIDDPKKARPHQIQKIGSQLRISIKLFDCQRAFNRQVVDYFTQTYLAGQTPNPCMVCNPDIKFGAVLSFARDLGADMLATGHYAGIRKDAAGIYHLIKGIDSKKDQSYFLARLNQAQLAKACFPLARRLKSDVRQMAHEKGLHPVKNTESQDVCFIRDTTYGEFVLNQSGFTPTPGPITDRHGKILGHHSGLHQFTIGQRRGINCPAAEPYYVLRLDQKANRLVVGSKSDLLASSCRVVDINWINEAPIEPITVLTRVRYRHKEVASTLFPIDQHTAEVRFDSAQSSITPGQGAVFYQGEEVLGGGFISSSHS